MMNKIFNYLKYSGLNVIIKLNPYHWRLNIAYRQTVDVWEQDALVIELRQWFDRYGDSFPYYQGYTSQRTTAIDLSDPLPLDRYSRHTVHCRTCSAAHEKMVKTMAEQALIVDMNEHIDKRKLN